MKQIGWLETMTQFLKQNFFKLILLYLGLLLIFGQKGLIDLYWLKKQYDALEPQIKALKHEQQTLGQLSNYNSAKETIEYFARKELGLAAKGDKIIILPPADEN